MNHPNEDAWAQNNLNESYNNSYSCSSGNYSVTTSYIGRYEAWRNPPMVKGESITLNGSFSKVPERIKAGEEVSMNITLSAGNNSLSFFTFWASGQAYFDRPDISPGSKSRSAISFTNDQKESSFRLKKANEYETISETVKANAPQGGNEGDQIAIITVFYRGVPMGTNYIYEWRKTGWEPSKNHYSYEESASTSTKRNAKRFDFPDDYDEVGPPADIFVTDMYNEVSIHVFENGLWDEYTPTLSHNIAENAVITTGPNSGMQLYIDGLGVFVVKENTDLKVGSKPEEEEGKISIFFGYVWGKFKEVYETGELNFPMSQAVAGIKATTFELYDDGETSTIRVYEGEVEFKSTNLNTSVMVGSGEAVEITETSIGEKRSFDVNTELEKWDQNVQVMTLEAIEEYQLSQEAQLTDESEETEVAEGNTQVQDEEEATVDESSGLPLILIIGGGLAILLVIVLLLIKKKSKNNQNIYLNESHYNQPRNNSNISNKQFCNNCCNELKESSKFCTECGHPRK